MVRNKNIQKNNIDRRIKAIKKEICETLGNLESIRGRNVLPLFLSSINGKTVDDVFESLRERYKSKIETGTLDVVLGSSGGSIDAAYNIGLLLRKYAPKELVFIIPRWAKSAATVLACSGDKIEMTPIAELGPVDPQITMQVVAERRTEQFSPLDIESTLTLIRDEFTNGHPELARGLLERLQFPLTLGGIKKSLDVGEQYLRYLLGTRMYKNDENTAHEIAKKLVHSYSTHAFCIDCDEAKQLGLKAELLPEDQIDCVWNLHKLIQEERYIQKECKEIECPDEQ